MEALLVLLLAYLAFSLIGVPIWTFIKFGNQQRKLESLEAELNSVQAELARLRTAATAARSAPDLAARPAAMVTTVVADTVISAPPSPPPQTAPSAPPLRPAQSTPPPSPAAPAATSPAMPEPPPLNRPVYRPPEPPPARRINWEQFMGAKLFAWVGGLALFLGIAFFVKYSFEQNLIPAQVRVAIGYVVAAGLIVGGLKLSRERYAITVQSLIGAGVVSLYAVTFACNSIYHFAFFGPLATFALMVLITATAFVLAVRLEAQAIAIIGMLGGFLTPWLLSTGHDNPPGLFGYLALLDLGLAAVALHRRWFHLVALAAGGTVIMMLGWTDKFYVPEKTTTAMVVSFSFAFLFFVIAEFGRRRDRSSPFLHGSAAAMVAVGFGYGAFFIGQADIGTTPVQLFAFILAIDAVALALCWFQDALAKVHFIAGFAVLTLLAWWTASHLIDEFLPMALAAYLAFGGLHSAFPPLLDRRRPDLAASWWSQIFPPLSLVMMLIPFGKLESVSFLVWPAVLLIDLAAITVAAMTASLAVMAGVLVLTLLVLGTAIMRVPAGGAIDVETIVIIGAFAVFFVAGCTWLARRLGPAVKEDSSGGIFARIAGDSRTQLPAFSALLPFILLVMVCARLAVPDPSMVFGLGALLVLLTLGLVRIAGVEWLGACALVGIGAVEFAWHKGHFDANAAAVPLAWYALFYAVFAIFPFLFRRQFIGQTGPWAVAALSGPVHFYLIYHALKLSWPAGIPGVIPALFVVAPLASLVAILRTEPRSPTARLNQLAWFGGAALFFVTLIFPIQFERQWLTVAWALEGLALAWLFQRVPHPGLRATGVVLLVVAGVRLTLNPAVFSYHVRGDVPIFNWFLYAYGAAIAATFIAARLLAPPRDRVLGFSAPILLNTIGAVLGFVLLNIEIADYFTSPGAATLAFRFSGNFARDMSYTIGWALFALGLLGAGIWTKSRAARYASIALLSIALLKLFFHDLDRLAQLYRIGALVGVAVIAMLASFAYQRFLPDHDKKS